MFRKSATTVTVQVQTVEGLRLDLAVARTVTVPQLLDQVLEQLGVREARWEGVWCLVSGVWCLVPTTEVLAGYSASTPRTAPARPSG